MKAPPRLLDDPQLAPELRKDLERSKETGSAYDAAAGLAVFSAAIAASAGGAAGTAAAAQAAAGQAGAAVKAAGVLGSLSAKATVAMLGTAAVVAVAVANLPAKQPAAPHARATVASVHATKKHAERAVSPSAPSAQAVSGAVGGEPAPVAPPREASPVPSRTAVPSPAVTQASRHGVELDVTARREIAQLGRIKALLEVNPAFAITLADAGNREFSHGMLREEREGLAALALWKLNQTRAAEARTRAFLERYPHSALRDQLSALMRARKQ